MRLFFKTRCSFLHFRELFGLVFNGFLHPFLGSVLCLRFRDFFSLNINASFQILLQDFFPIDFCLVFLCRTPLTFQLLTMSFCLGKIAFKFLQISVSFLTFCVYVMKLFELLPLYSQLLLCFASFLFVFLYQIFGFWAEKVFIVQKAGGKPETISLFDNDLRVRPLSSWANNDDVIWATPSICGTSGFNILSKSLLARG